MWGLVTLAPAITIYGDLKVLVHASFSPTPQRLEGVSACTIFLPTPDGKIVRIVHANGHTEISKADHLVSLLHIAI